MNPSNHVRPRGLVLLLAGLTGVAVAALAGMAFAKTFTLQVAKNAKVVNANTQAVKHESIAVSSRGAALYTLSGETTRHAKCTKADGCFVFWPPLKVKSSKGLSKAAGIKGKLGVWHRDGFMQVTLAGHPLYRFAPDKQKRVATGEAIVSFRGTWHVVKASGGSSGSGSMTTSTSTSTSTSPTTTGGGYY